MEVAESDIQVYTAPALKAMHIYMRLLGASQALQAKDMAASAGDAADMGLIPGLQRSPEVGNGTPLQLLLPGKSHGQRRLEGCSPWGR